MKNARKNHRSEKINISGVDKKRVSCKEKQTIAAV